MDQGGNSRNLNILGGESNYDAINFQSQNRTFNQSMM